MDRPVPLNNRRFNTLAASVYAAFLLFAIVGCWQADIDLPYAGTGVLLRCICLAIFLSLPVYWHVKHRPDRREAALAPFWLLAFSFTLPAIVNLCGRSEMPLQDLNLVRLDSMLGINVPAIAAWADQHRLGHLINDTYPMLMYYLIPLAVLAPALFGRWIAAREFLAANIIAMIIGLTAFALLPAVGPWYGYNLPSGPGQKFCQTQLLLLREPGPIVAQQAGIICFPSFHVIWAIFCARALWTFRLIRIPVCVFAGLVILSTITTGWHYFVDVVAGFIIAYISIRIASRIIGNQPQTACATLPLRVATAAIPTQDPSIAQE